MFDKIFGKVKNSSEKKDTLTVYRELGTVIDKSLDVARSETLKNFNMVLKLDMAKLSNLLMLRATSMSVSEINNFVKYFNDSTLYVFNDENENNTIFVMAPTELEMFVILDEEIIEGFQSLIHMLIVTSKSVAATVGLNVDFDYIDCDFLHANYDTEIIFQKIVEHVLDEENRTSSPFDTFDDL